MTVLKFLIWCLLSFAADASDDDLCSSDIFDNKCMCKKFTDQATNIPSSLANCNSLRLGKFPDLSKLPEDLTDLDLSLNHIQRLEKDTNSTTLQKLILSHNGISHIDDAFLTGLPGLKILDLSHNNLTAFPGFGKIFNQLVYIDLSYNNFKELDKGLFAVVPHLQFLDLSYNPLGDFLMTNSLENVEISSNITHLKLNHVGLGDPQPDYFTPFQTLKHLEIQDNTFELIPSLPYSIEYLDLSGNNLTFVSARYLNFHSLKHLRLSRMPSLVSIHHYAFYNLQSLETLIVTDCPNVEEFTDLAFGMASKTMDIHPKTLVLARNGIPKLNQSYAHMFRNMKRIDLRHNPWNCDCDVFWLQEFGAELYKGRELRCASPGALKRKRILDLTHFDLPDCFPQIYGKTSHRITIVILMTAVLFLMGLIFYLIRYPKSWVSHRQMGIGPNSPYSPAPQEDVRF